MQHQTADDYLNSLEDYTNVIKSRRPVLPVTVLVSEGERFDQAFLLKQLHYDPSIVPTIPRTDRSDEVMLLDTDAGGSYVPASLHYGEANGLRDKVRSLRMSWIFAVDIAPVSDCSIDGIIILERRALPLVDADKLCTIINTVRSQHPDTDVIRLFDTHSYDRYTLGTIDVAGEEFLGDIDREDISKELPAGKTSTKLSAECDGSYAVYISNKSRAKVSDCLRNVRMPVDTVFEYAASIGKLKVRSLNVNAFIRDGGYKMPCSGYKYCVQLSSYNRPMQLLSQIISIKDQLRYVKCASRVFIHIVVRGCDKITYDLISKRAALELKGYGHKVSALPNRSQIINFIEAPSGFDFYLKMDDDDFYDTLYLASTVEFHDKLPSYMCSTMCGGNVGVDVCMRSISQERSIMREDKTGACENTLVFAANVIDHLVRLSATTRIRTTSGKATDAVPMRTISNSLLSLNRYNYWRFMSILHGRDNSTFSVLNYEGNAHATGASNFGAFAATAGAGAAEYYIRVFDSLEWVRSTTDFIRENFNKFSGIDVAVVTDAPGDTTGMYIPMNTKWCSIETAAAQVIEDIEYDGAFIVSFKFARTGNKYVYEPVRGVMVPDAMYSKWKEDMAENKNKMEFQEWLMTTVIKSPVNDHP